MSRPLAVCLFACALLVNPLGAGKLRAQVISSTGLSANVQFAVGDWPKEFGRTSKLVMGPTRFHVDNGDVKALVLLDNETGGLELLPVNDAASSNWGLPPTTRSLAKTSHGAAKLPVCAQRTSA